MAIRKPSIPSIPHSWAIDDWPAHVYPGRASRARYIVRTHKDDLIAAGALTRIGRELVVMGAGYASWLAKHSGRVDGYTIAPNAAEPELKAA